MRYDGYKSRLTGNALREHHEREKKRQARAFDMRRMQATFKSALASSNRSPITLPRVKFLEGAGPETNRREE
jgi:hypothetical protein